MHWMNLPRRMPVVRAVARSRPQRRNETVAIVIIEPLPGNALHFPTIRQVLREFLVDERHLGVHDIQPSHLDQAIVCFNTPSERDSMVINSLHQMGDVTVSFTRHNQGRNWRRVNFNHDC
jgi:hypothetical protein